MHCARLHGPPRILESGKGKKIISHFSIVLLSAHTMHSRPSTQRTNNNNNNHWLPSNFHYLLNMHFFVGSYWIPSIRSAHAHALRRIWNEYANTRCTFVRPLIDNGSNKNNCHHFDEENKQQTVRCSHHRCGHNLGSNIFCSLQITAWPGDSSPYMCVPWLLWFV